MLKYVRGVRSKVGGEHQNASTPRASPVPTRSAATSGTQMLRSTLSSGMASMAAQNRSRRFAAKPVVPPSRARRNTPLYRLKTPSQQVAMVLSALAEGLDPSAASRVAGLSTSHDYHLVDSCWGTRTDLARAVLLPSVAPARAIGRTAHAAAQPDTGAVALAGD